MHAYFSMNLKCSKMRLLTKNSLLTFNGVFIRQQPFSNTTCTNKGQRSLTWEPACHKNILIVKDFFRRSKAALQYMVGSGRIVNWSKTLHWVVLVTCKNEEDLIHKRRRLSVHSIIHWFFRRSRSGNSIVCGRNSAVFGRMWPEFELVRYIINGLFTCKYEEDQIKNKGSDC